jgi:HlyD family secretion protein
MPMSFRKILIGAVGVAALGGLGWMVTRPEIVPVDIAMLANGPLEVTINADGETRIRDIYEVSAPVSGRLLRSPVKIGDTVNESETIVARIEPGEPAFLDTRSLSQAQAAVKQAEAALALAETQITMAELDLGHSQLELNRLHDLYERGTIPQARLEDAELAVDVAAAKLDSAHASYDMRMSELEAQRALLVPPQGAEGGSTGTTCCIEIVAPVSGEVLEVVNESARMVSVGMPIVSIGRRGDMEIVVDLLSSDAVRIALGAPAYVERWGGAEGLEAEVRRIEPAGFTKISALGIEEQRVKVQLDFTTPEADRMGLGHGFRVHLRIVEWRGDEVLRLPISALFRSDGAWAVFAFEAGAARLKRVEIGRRNTDFAEVLSGLEAGEVVILHPSDRISDGVLVADRESL